MQARKVGLDFVSVDCRSGLDFVSWLSLARCSWFMAYGACFMAHALWLMAHGTKMVLAHGCSSYMVHCSWLNLVWRPGVRSWPGPDGPLGIMAHGCLGLSGLDIAHGHLINFKFLF